MDLGTLTGGLGCFPFDNGPYHPLSDCCTYKYDIRSLIDISIPGWDRQPFSALPSYH